MKKSLFALLVTISALFYIAFTSNDPLVAFPAIFMAVVFAAIGREVIISNKKNLA